MASTLHPQNGTGIVIITLVIAMVLMIVPLPQKIELFRPEFVLMALIYWAMATPTRVGVGVAWFTGLLMDAALGMTLGISAFAYALVIYMVARFYLQLRQYPLWQQAWIILSLVLLVQIIIIFLSPQAANWYLWLPALTSTLVWPLNYMILRMVRRSFLVR